MVWRITPSNLLVDDPDALAYLAAVEVADGQALESGVRLAVNAFVKGCKADGIWPAIKASCILVGARTLNGALQPLVGSAPTNFNFVSGDYNRKTGLAGNGSTKYLASGQNSNSSPTNNHHMSIYASSMGTSGTNRGHIGSTYTSPTADLTDIISLSDNRLILRSRTPDGLGQVASPAGNTSIFSGVSRSSSENYIHRQNFANTIIPRSSFAASSFQIEVFRAKPSPLIYSDARLAFYSIGESLNLALLDNHVTTLINAIAATIP